MKVANLVTNDRFEFGGLTLTLDRLSECNRDYLEYGNKLSDTERVSIFKAYDVGLGASTYPDEFVWMVSYAVSNGLSSDYYFFAMDSFDDAGDFVSNIDINREHVSVVTRTEIYFN